MRAVQSPPWLAAVATGVAYLGLLAVLFVLLFVLPYVVFVAA